MGYAFFFQGSVKKFPKPTSTTKVNTYTLHTHLDTMKLSTIFTAFAATIATVAGYETTGSKQTVDILIDYIIKKHQNYLKTTWPMGNGDTVTLQYVVNNNEESEITVVGVTGQFKTP